MKPGPDAEPIEIEPDAPRNPDIEPSRQEIRAVPTPHDQINRFGLARDAVNEFSGIQGILSGRDQSLGSPKLLSAILQPRKHYAERLQDTEDRMTASHEPNPDPDIAAYEDALRVAYTDYKDRMMEKSTDYPSATKSIEEFDVAVDEYNKALEEYKSAINPDEQELALTKMLAASNKALCLFSEKPPK